MLANTHGLAGRCGGAAIFTGGAVYGAQLHMLAALEALTQAKGELQQAEANKGGHRVQAIKLVDQAIAEVKAGVGAAGG